MGRGDDLRYSFFSNIMLVIIKMQSEPNGLTLEEIAATADISVRTAYRVKDVILRNFKQINFLGVDKDHHKRWGFLGSAATDLLQNLAINFTDKEITTLENLKTLLKNKQQIKQIDKIIIKIKALMKTNNNN